MSFFERMFLQGVPEEEPKREGGVLRSLLSGAVEDDSGEEKIPPTRERRVSSERIAEAMLVPAESEDLLPAKREKKKRGLIGQLFYYLVTPVPAGFNALVMRWTPEPEDLMSDGVVELERRVKEVDRLEEEVTRRETRGFFEMLATQILQTNGPIREASTKDPDERKRLPTDQERWLASELAIELARSLNGGGDRNRAFEEWLDLLKKRVEGVNFAVLRRSLEENFTKEELLRIAGELKRIIKSHGGELELMHIPPSDLIIAAVFAAQGLLGEALSAALFPNELGKKGVSIVLGENPNTGELELRVLWGGVGRGQNTLPGDAQPEWTQPLVHEIVTDTTRGHRWVERWVVAGKVTGGAVSATVEIIKRRGKGWRGIWREKIRRARTSPGKGVEAGRFRLVNPYEGSDKVEVPLAVRRSVDKPSSIGGGFVFGRASKASRKARQIVGAALKVAKERAERRGIDWRIALEGSPRSKDDSLRRAYEETVGLLLREGIREEVVKELAIKYMEELTRRGGGIEIGGEEISFERWERERRLREQRLLRLVDELVRLNKRIKQARSPELKAHWGKRKKRVLRELRELSRVGTE